MRRGARHLKEIGARWGDRPRRPRGRSPVRAAAAALLALTAFTGCAQLRERLGTNRAPAGPVPVEVPTSDAFLGFDRILRAPGEPDGRFQLVSFPDSTGSRSLADGDSAVLLDLPGPAVVRRIRIALTSADPDFPRRIALRMYWDEEGAPSVDVPLGDFFANGFERRPFASVPMGAGDGGYYGYLPMPFARRGRIVLENGTGAPIEVAFDADVQVEAALPVPLATLHASWRREARPRSGERHMVADIRGAGWLIGTSLSAQGYEGTLSFLEGNGAFRVDGRTYGVATTGYLNAGAVADTTGGAAGAGATSPSPGAGSGAFAGVTLRDDARGRIAAYRWHLPDPVPFRESLRLELERGRANRDAADFATVAYWYQTEPHEPFPALPFPTERRVPEVLIPADAQRTGEYEMVGTGAGTVRITARAPRADLYEVVVYPEASPGSASPTVQVRSSRRAPRALDVSPPGAEPGDLLPGVVVDTVAVRGAPAVELELVARGGGIALPVAVHLRPLAPWADQWQVVGPWPYGGAAGAANPTDFVWPPELEPSALDYAAPGRATETERRLSWRPADVDASGALSFAPLFPGTARATAYAQTFLWSADERTATLVLRTDDAYQLWLGDLPIARGMGAGEPGEADIPVFLRAGWNRVLLELAASAGWRVRLRAADPTGGLRWSSRPTDG